MSVAIRIIPCLDVKDGRVVKGVNFRGLKDAGDPVELASRYDAQGADEITFLDVSASHEGRSTMLDVVSRTAEQVFVPLTVGGGVSSVNDVDQLLRAGADKVGINTAAITRPELLARWQSVSATRWWCCRWTRAGVLPASAPPQATRSPLTEDVPRPGSTPSPGRFEAQSSVPERFF